MERGCTAERSAGREHAFRIGGIIGKIFRSCCQFHAIMNEAVRMVSVYDRGMQTSYFR